MTAVGSDEDGEPACSGHMLRRPLGLNVHEHDLSAGNAAGAFKKLPAKKPTVPIRPPRQAVVAKKLCACGCGTTFQATSNAQKWVRGHKPGKLAIQQSPKINVAIVHKPKPSVSIERSVTHSQKMTVSANSNENEFAIELGRRVTVIIPRAQPTTQVRLTPELAQAIWKSLTVQQKYELMDCEGMWNDFDDECRMSVVNKVLLVNAATTETK